MMTVLYVMIALIAAVAVASAFDARRAAASDISDYLRYEYQMDASRNSAFSQLRNI